MYFHPAPSKNALLENNAWLLCPAIEAFETWATLTELPQALGVTPSPRLPELSTRNRSAPLVSTVTVSAAGKRMAVFVSPECTILSAMVTSPEAVTVVNVPAAAEDPPMVVPSIAPLSMSTLVMFTSPVPLGVRLMSPLVLVEEIVLPFRLMLST